MFDLNVVGLGEITDVFETCQKNEAKLLRKATIAGAKIILKAAKEKCPTSVDGHYVKIKSGKGYRLKPGNLKRSLKIKAVKPREPGKQLVLIGPETGKKAKHDGWYGFLVEKGTSKNEPQPFLRPAFDENADRAYNEMARIYGDEWGNTVIQDISDIGDILAGGD